MRAHSYAQSDRVISYESPKGVRAMVENLREAGWLQKEKQDLSSCLIPLLEVLAWEGDTKALSYALPQNGQPMDIVDLCNTLVLLGYQCTEKKVTLKDLQKGSYPALFIPKNLHIPTYIVTDHTTEGWITCDTVTHEKATVTEADMEGVAYLFSSYVDGHDHIEQFVRSKAGYTWFHTLTERFGAVFWRIVFISAVIGILALGVPLFVMVVYDNVIAAHSISTISNATSTLLMLALGALLFIATEAALRHIRLYALSWYGTRVSVLVGNAIFKQMLALPAASTERIPVATQLARLKAFESVRDFITGPAFLVLLDLPMVAILILAIGVMAGPLIVVSGVILAVYCGLFALAYKKLAMIVMRSARTGAEKQQATIEVAAQLHSMRISGVTNALLARFNVLSSKAALAAMQTNFAFAMIEHVAYALTVFASVGTIIWGVERIWAGDMSIGALVATMILTWRILGPLQTACALLPRVHHVLGSIDQINKFMSVKAANENQEGLVVNSLSGKIAFVNVGVRYSATSDPLFLGLSFDAEPGELIAITGRTGSGMTSILKLAVGLYPPQIGNIRLDDIDIRQFNPSSLCRKISYFPQNPSCFTGSLIEHLRFAKPDALEHEIVQVLRQANAWNEVQALPKGMYSKISPGELTLTPEFVTKLHLARLYLNPQPLIIIDELPHTLLSGVTGENFKAFLKNSRGNYTVVYATRYNELIAIADKVIVLRQDQRPVLATPSQLFTPQPIARG